MIGQISAASEEQLETIWYTVEAETDPVNQKQEKINYLKQKGERELNA